jgi:glutamate synthase domain-containing protein 2
MKCDIVVIDGMGGGIGVELVSRVRKEFGNEVNIIALGTNSVATDKMVQAKANKGATGENAIRCSINLGDFVLGAIGIVFPNGLMGEVTKEIAEIVMSSRGKKILIPVNHPDLKLIGLKNEALSQLIEEAVFELKNMTKSI